MYLNSLETKILNYLKKGENITTITHLAEHLNICRPTIVKYIQRLEQKKLLHKKTIGLKGGTTGDATRSTIIIKF